MRPVRPIPTVPILSYAWDVDGDGKIDGFGQTFDVSYPTAGARAITLKVTDNAGAHSSRTLPVYVGGKTTPPGTAEPVAGLRATLSAVGRQTLKAVRRRGLLVRFRCSASATWTLTATLRRARGAPGVALARRDRSARQADLHGAHGHGHGPAPHPEGPAGRMREVVIRVQARVRADGKSVQRSLIVRIGA